jgi:hypothetical protein
MSFKEINSWLVLGVFAWLFVDFGFPLFEARSLEGDQSMIGSVIAFIIILVIAHIIVGVIRRKPAEDEDERDRMIELRAERVGAYALGAVALTGVFLSLRMGDFRAANFLFLALVFSEIAKRIWQVFLYRRGS